MDEHAVNEPGEDAVRNALELIVDPCSIATGVPISLVQMGLVKEITSAGGDVTIILRLTSPICWQGANILRSVEEAAGTLAGVRSVKCILDPAGEWMPDMMSPDARARLRKLRPLSKVPSA
jgi:metal-sulfur cluster biosynthetic enzyme